METKTKHKIDCKRVFGRYDIDCVRCQELMAGLEPRKGWGWLNKENEKRRSEAIRKHNCTTSNCGSVCTAFDW